MLKRVLSIGLLSGLLALAACGGGGGDSGGSPPPLGPPPPNARVSWTANPETAVNSAGGGYKVYYSRTAGFSITGASVVDVPFVSGSAPTSATLTLPSGTHYFKVVAYSALNSAGSNPSAEMTVTIP